MQSRVAVVLVDYLKLALLCRWRQSRVIGIIAFVSGVNSLRSALLAFLELLFVRFLTDYSLFRFCQFLQSKVRNLIVNVVVYYINLSAWFRPAVFLTALAVFAVARSGADSMAAMGTFARVLLKVLGREYSFAPVLFGLTTSLCDLEWILDIANSCF